MSMEGCNLLCEELLKVDCEFFVINFRFAGYWERHEQWWHNEDIEDS